MQPDHYQMPGFSHRPMEKGKILHIIKMNLQNDHLFLNLQIWQQGGQEILEANYNESV